MDVRPTAETIDDAQPDTTTRAPSNPNNRIETSQGAQELRAAAWPPPSPSGVGLSRQQPRPAQAARRPKRNKNCQPRCTRSTRTEWARRDATTRGERSRNPGARRETPVHTAVHHHYKAAVKDNKKDRADHDGGRLRENRSRPRNNPKPQSAPKHGPPPRHPRPAGTRATQRRSPPQSDRRRQTTWYGAGASARRQATLAGRIRSSATPTAPERPLRLGLSPSYTIGAQRLSPPPRNRWRVPVDARHPAVTTSTASPTTRPAKIRPVRPAPTKSGYNETCGMSSMTRTMRRRTNTRKGPPDRDGRRHPLWRPGDAGQ